jgi:mediator of RNA polymerase II transcription subunit 17, fungi type
VPLTLPPIIDLLQYIVFCRRIKAEIDEIAAALGQVGVQAMLRFNPIGELGKELVESLTSNRHQPIGGEAVLRIDNRCVMTSPRRTCTHAAIYISQGILFG